MSYDLTFLVKSAGQSWEDAIEALGAWEEAGESGPQERPDAQAWERILTGARELLGQVEVHAADAWYGSPMSRRRSRSAWRPTRRRSRCRTGTAARGSSRWYAWRTASARSSSRPPAWPGYDPQLGMPVGEAGSQIAQAVAVFDSTAAMFAQRGIRTGG